MTTPDKYQAARILARRKFNRMTTSQLPIEAGTLDPLFLNLLGAPELVVEIVRLIATTEYGLVINDKGLIDLPKNEPKDPHQSLEMRYREPIEIPGVPPIEYNRPYRRGKVDRKKGQE